VQRFSLVNVNKGIDVSDKGGGQFNLAQYGGGYVAMQQKT
jgi:hypothetical protein